jgi:hypothetical protein
MIRMTTNRILTGAEVTDGLVFAVATLIICPQLPNRYLGPFQALNPHSIWSDRGADARRGEQPDQAAHLQLQRCRRR